MFINAFWAPLVNHGEEVSVNMKTLLCGIKFTGFCGWTLIFIDIPTSYRFMLLVSGWLCVGPSFGLQGTTVVLFEHSECWPLFWMASDMSLYRNRFCFRHPQQPLLGKKEPTEAAFPAPNTSFFQQETGSDFQLCLWLSIPSSKPHNV